jgi:hypothetical protein
MSTRPVTGLSALVRPKFEPGMLLQHDDLDQLGTYTRDLSRLLFKSFFGCGVVCGLVVESVCEDGKAVVKVAAGLALNCTGDPIAVPSNDHSILIPPRDTTKKNDDLRYVLLCPHKKSCFPRTSMCASDDDDGGSQFTRDREGYEIKVVVDKPTCCLCEPHKAAKGTADDKCKCANPELDCLKAHYAGKCECDCDNCTGHGCDCVVLALLMAPKDVTQPWKVDHSVRRFIRPVLMRDPQIELDTP